MMRRLVVLLVAALFLAGSGLLIAGLHETVPVPVAEPLDVPITSVVDRVGSAPRPEAPPVRSVERRPDRAKVEVLEGAAAGEGRLIGPHGLNVDLLTMSVTDGVVDPPTFEDAYLVEGYGSPHGLGTVYVAMHSGRGVQAAGNALIDVASGTAKVQPGEWFVVDSIVYTVEEVRLVDKNAVVEETDLWEPVDGRLVLFTCMQRPEGRSLKNVVVIATRDGRLGESLEEVSHVSLDQ